MAARFSLASEKLSTWASSLALAVVEKKGVKAARLLQPNYILERVEKEEILTTKLTVFEAFCTQFTKGQYKIGDGVLKTILVTMFQVLQEKCDATPNFPTIVNLAIETLNAWVNLYRSPEVKPFNWLIPGLISLLVLLHDVGEEADMREKTFEILDVEDETDTKINSAASLRQTRNQEKVLNAIRQHIGKFRGDENREGGYIVLITESIKTCIALGNVQMASSFLKTAESSVINSFNVPRGPLVSFNYLIGKLYMQQENFSKAEDALSWSLQHCSSLKQDLITQILECLIPVRLRIGKIPKLQLLRKYKLHHYIEIVTAVKTGCIRKFENVISREMRHFINEGTLLCVEKLKFVVLRTLFSKIYRWTTREENSTLLSQKNVIPISLFTAGFKWQMENNDIELTDEETACIIANLIKLGYVKGYIAWEHGKVVLSKASPIAPLGSP